MKQEKTMKSGKKLKDYPQVPSTPPPSEKKDRSLIHLEEELEHERKYVCALNLENKELEEILQNFDKEITYIKSNFPQQIAGDKKLHASNEYWFKYESQMEQIRKLEREKKNLENEIKQIEEQGMINLDSLTQSELIMYVKQLERTKTNLLSDLRSKEWGLDKQAKDIHHLNEVKRALQSEIRHYDKEIALYRHYKKNSCASATITLRRNSYGNDGKKMKIWRNREKGKNDESDILISKHSRLSQEDVSKEGKSDVMFSSLDESKLERMTNESPTPGFHRRTLKGGISERKRIIDVKKGPIKKTVAIGSLPELLKSKSPSPRSTKTTGGKSENKVGTESGSKPSSATRNNRNEPIKIIVTYETQRTPIAGKNSSTEKTTSEEEGKSDKDKLESFRSIEEVYEDDFEGSDLENVGYLTTRVKKKSKAAMLKTEEFETDSEEEIKKGKKTKRTKKKLQAFRYEPSSGKQFIITIRIIAKIVPNAPPKFTVNQEETTIVPL